MLIAWIVKICEETNFFTETLGMFGASSQHCLKCEDLERNMLYMEPPRESEWELLGSILFFKLLEIVTFK